MDSQIKSSKKELLDTIHNLMAVIDTPLGRLKIKGDFVDEVRIEARKVMVKNNRSLFGEIPSDQWEKCVECGKPMDYMEHNYGTPDHMCCLQCYNDAQQK